MSAVTTRALARHRETFGADEWRGQETSRQQIPGLDHELQDLWDVRDPLACIVWSPAGLWVWLGGAIPEDMELLGCTCALMAWSTLGLIARVCAQVRQKTPWAWWEIMVPACCLVVGPLILFCAKPLTLLTGL